ncbi:DUF3892 domain-containing protein [Mycetocola zhadangensis]|uniref:DUF3892 domain-containing protein n=1 Tax=Mycetocola zhadangensis TaxID=1164595 RepID=UPI003A4E235C
MLYIRRVRVAKPGTHNHHITAVQYSTTPHGTMTDETTETMVRLVDTVTQVCSHNDQTGAEAAVKTRIGPSGRKYITTVADGRESNNLLELPRF